MNNELAQDLISRTPTPLTIKTLETGFVNLGVRAGMVLLVHASLSSFGWVCGGPVAVILALESLLGQDGTLVMPAFSGELSEPSFWINPPVPEQWWPIIRSNMPAFDVNLTPTRKMGVIAETFRKQDKVLRSNHPQVSFVARGKYAKFITDNHALQYAFGELSPVARVYDLGGSILLAGVDYTRNSSLHLAEFRAEYPGKKTEKGGSPVVENNHRVWREIEDIASDCGDFEKIGRDFEMENPGAFTSGKVGQANVRLIQHRPFVDFAVHWMGKNRK